MTDPGISTFGAFVTNLFGERYLYEVNHSAFNQVGSKALYQQHYAELFQAKNSLFVIVGTDSGLLLNYLQDVGLPVGSRALFIELPDVLRRLDEVTDLSTLPESIFLRSTENWSEILDELNFTSYVYLDALNLVESIGALDGHLPEYKEVHWTLKQQLEIQNWQVKATLGAELFLIRQFENLADNWHPASCLKGGFAGKTGVVLGGGPSLDTILPWLLDHKDEVVIIAVSRVSRRLLDVGLAPHLVFTTDPQSVSYEVSKDMLRFGPETVLVSAYHACPQLVGQWQGHKLYLGPRLPWSSSLSPENYDLSGPTVTNSALATAVKMGFSQILLAGFDLCFSKEGYSHAQGSQERDLGPRVAEQYPTVETFSGAMVSTTQAYFSAMTDLAQNTKAAVEDGCQIINIAEGAAKVENVTYQPLEKVQIFSCVENPEKTIQSALPDDDIDQYRKYTTAMKSELRSTQVSLRKMQNLAQEALECNDGLFGRNGKRADFKYKIRMDKIEKRLKREFSDLTFLVKQFGIRGFLKTTRPDSSSEWTDEEIEETGRVYYESYFASCKELGQMLELAQQRLEMREAEYDTDPDLESLEPFWVQESLLGRAQTMLDAGPAQVPDVGVKLKNLANLFWEQVGTHDVWERDAFVQPASVRSKALLCFRKKDLVELVMLQQSLANHYQSIESVQHIQPLIDGYIAELEDQPELALEFYHGLIGEEMDSLTEEALTRIASLSLRLKDPDNTLIALECLSNISPTYQPNYASILRLMGKHQEAAEVYGDYLTKMPDDAITMLKLGQLYMEMDALDAARIAFGYVLEMDPDNTAAAILLEQLGGGNA